MQGRIQHCVTSVSRRSGSWMNQPGSGHGCSQNPHLCSTGWKSRVLHAALASLQAQASRAGCSFLMGRDQEGWSRAVPVLTPASLCPCDQAPHPVENKKISFQLH